MNATYEKQSFVGRLIRFLFSPSLLLCIATTLAVNTAKSETIKIDILPAEQAELQQMPWYDTQIPGYKKYTPKEILKALRKEKSKSKSDPNPISKYLEGLLPLLQSFLQVMAYGVLAILSFFLLYGLFILLKRYRQKKMNEKTINFPTGFAHENVFAELNTPLDLNESTLRQSIIDALHSRALQSAARFMFIYAVLIYSRRGLIRLFQSRTAREYNRELELNDSATENEVNVFHGIRECFEIAVYRKTDPPHKILLELWQRFSESCI